jgi:hypothetical protein
MKRLIRVFAIAAPVLAVGAWAIVDETIKLEAPVHRIHDPENPWHGHSRQMPANGPIAAPDGTQLELAIPITQIQNHLSGVESRVIMQQHDDTGS